MKTANNYTIPLTKLITELDSDRVNGLTSLEATNRISRYGSNTIQSDKGKHPLKIVLSQFNNLLVYLLFFAAAMSFWFQEYLDATAILLVEQAPNILFQKESNLKVKTYLLELIL